eukprot:16441781-Heterocapsa_arctica.AAC.1
MLGYRLQLLAKWVGIKRPRPVLNMVGRGQQTSTALTFERGSQVGARTRSSGTQDDRTRSSDMGTDAGTEYHDMATGDDRMEAEQPAPHFHDLRPQIEQLRAEAEASVMVQANQERVEIEAMRQNARAHLQQQADATSRHFEQQYQVGMARIQHETTEAQIIQIEQQNAFNCQVAQAQSEHAKAVIDLGQQIGKPHRDKGRFVNQSSDKPEVSDEQNKTTKQIIASGRAGSSTDPTPEQPHATTKKEDQKADMGTRTRRANPAIITTSKETETNNPTTSSTNNREGNNI